MTSLAKIAANRTNAKLSTGPKSAIGRWRAAQNARRHGLGVPVLRDPVLAKEVTIVALQLMRNLGSVETAYAIAEAEIDLKRIREIKQTLLNRLSKNDRVIAKSERRSKPNLDFSAGEKHGARTGGLLEQISRIDRYERRAIGRRQSAILRLTNFVWTDPKIGKTKPKL
jgi:hypothetical protein